MLFRSESYLDAVAWTLDGDAMIAEDATVQDSDIGANVQVMAGAEIRGSTVRDSVVFPNATVVDCDLRDSIIDEDTHVEGLDLAGALIGAHTRLANGE